MITMNILATTNSLCLAVCGVLDVHARGHSAAPLQLSIGIGLLAS